MDLCAVINPALVQLPCYAARSLLRMTLAFGLSLGFALAYGIATAMSRRASHVLLPVLDVLQSVPVLGFLPVVFLFILTRIPSMIGAELASIILIFTAMVWAMTFAVIAGVNAIPADIKEASRAYGVTRGRYLWQVVLPAVYPELVWGCILAWGGAWYFIPVEEYATFAHTTVTLPGLGYFIAYAASQNDLSSALIGLAALVAVIVAINRLIWRPLVARTEKYRYEGTATHTNGRAKHGKLSTTLTRYEGRVATPILSFLKYEKTYLFSIFESVHIPPRFHITSVKVRQRLARVFLVTRIIVVVGLLGLIFLVVFLLENSPVPTIQSVLEQIKSFNPTASTSCGGLCYLGYATARSLLRLFTAYLIALGWTLLAGIAIARKQILAKILIPIFDVGQSIPATALFPIITLVILGRVPNEFGQEIAAVLLLLTGMQWYILFNIIGAIHNIPTDILESASAYGVRGARFTREITIPASFPAMVSGSIQAWGGGWNSTIVSEAIPNPVSPSQYLALPGLGATLVIANNAGNTIIVASTIVIMTITILILNRLIWHRLLKKADKFKFEY